MRNGEGVRHVMRVSLTGAPDTALALALGAAVPALVADANVVLTGDEKELAFLESYAAQLPMLFIVSDVELRPAAAGETTPDGLRITIERASGVKCERCWRIVPAVSEAPASAGLCPRCEDALAGQLHG